MIELELDLLQTVALALVVYFIGIQLRRRIDWLDRLNIPAAVVGGLLFTGLAMALRSVVSVELDTGAQQLLSVAFFTSIGMGASLALLRIGGLQVLIFLVFATIFCFIQNFAGMAIATGFGEHPLFGVMAGSVTLVGGPATGLAFAPLFEEAGLTGAGTLALAAATIGIVCGGLAGGPAGTWLIKRHRLSSRPAEPGAAASPLEILDDPEEAPEDTIIVEVAREDTSLVRNIVILALAMLVGSVVSVWIGSTGVTLPAYIGAMLVASVLRNADDVTHRLRINQPAMEFIGNLALNVFLTTALMNLRLWELASVALPLLAILVVQVVLVVLAAVTVSYLIMGRDYDSAVMSGGFIGFVLGTTANAVANMRSLEARFGAAPRAFLVVPLVGAFFIDFTNALIITLFLNWLG
ncbi:MAG: sodium/glutamate symporter [Gemmatimonadota bacterium]|nr:sodium/glutamate symporter [Gemmatimonadota bacterium]